MAKQPQTRTAGSRPAASPTTGNRAGAPMVTSTWGRAMLAAGAVLVVALVGYLVLRGTESDAGPATGGAALEHVHGLGVDPGDETLYAGTHYGLFALPEQENVTRVADHAQDFMGFTVAGPDHFLASGHPGEGQGGPSSVGLIESTDGGETWQSLSLPGEADFHALEYRHGQVYGTNSMTGEFMVSDDKETWDIRTRLPMADFTVSPQDPEVILATTEQGLVRSENGGRTFGALRDAPLFLLISWAEDGTIVGVGPAGDVAVSTDDGASWQQRGTLTGSPEALVARSQDEMYVAAGGAVLASNDGGRKFTARYRD